MVPLPPKVYLSGEQAESTAHLLLRAQGGRTGAPDAWLQLSSALGAGDLSLRTFLRSNLDYKATVALQGRGEGAGRLLRLARLPHWVWIVEAQLRDRRKAGGPAVVAEVVFDSTSSDRQPAVSALALPGIINTFPPDGGQRAVATGASAAWHSHQSLAWRGE